MRFIFRIIVLLALMTKGAFAADEVKIRILYAEQQVERPPTLSNLSPVPEDLGRMGARLGREENAAGGRFLQHVYELDEITASPDNKLAILIGDKLNEGYDLVLLNAPAQDVVAIADLPIMQGKIIFNIGAPDDALREEFCRPNVLHTLPSRSMLTDALAQFLLRKQWRNWLLIEGPKANDKAWALAFRESAVKFGGKIVAERPWVLDADMRDSAAEEVPLMTQDVEYDVAIVADENNDFGPYIAYNTWLARPVAGTHGLRPTGWSGVIEPWGAAQLQNRFRKLAGRDMRDIDFAAWMAMRIIYEAVTRTKTSDVKTLKSYILSDALQLSAFKGRGLTFRPWNGQLRQPIHLVTGDAQVAVAPIEGFLHQVTELDTLGKDEFETQCKGFRQP